MPRLPPARLKRPANGAMPTIAWSRALGAVARVNAMYVGGALIAIGLAGSMITSGQGLKGQGVLQHHRLQKAKRASQVPRARFGPCGSFAPTVTRPAAASNAARARSF